MAPTDSTKRSLDALPPEIQHMIYDNLSDRSTSDLQILQLASTVIRGHRARLGNHRVHDSSALASLMRVNKGMRAFVEHLLYHTLIHHHEDNKRTAPLQLFATLLQNPRLGRYIRRIIRVPTRNTTYSQPYRASHCELGTMRRLDYLLRTLNREIPGMKGVKSLISSKAMANALLQRNEAARWAIRGDTRATHEGYFYVDWLHGISLMAPNASLVVYSGRPGLRNPQVCEDMFTEKYASTAAVSTNLTHVYLASGMTSPERVLYTMHHPNLRHLVLESALDDHDNQCHYPGSPVNLLDRRDFCSLDTLYLHMHCPCIFWFLAPVCSKLRRLELVLSRRRSVCDIVFTFFFFGGNSFVDDYVPVEELRVTAETVEEDRPDISVCEVLLAGLTGLKRLELDRRIWRELVEGDDAPTNRLDGLPQQIEVLALQVYLEDLQEILDMLASRHKLTRLRRIHFIVTGLHGQIVLGPLPRDVLEPQVDLTVTCSFGGGQVMFGWR